MCAQFQIKSEPKRLGEIFAPFLHPFSWSESVRPTDTAPVVTWSNQGPVIHPMQFSLIPFWSQERKVKFASYNARLYSTDIKTGRIIPIFEKPAWKSAFLKGRCFVPMTAFVEPIYHAELGGNMVRFSSQTSEFLRAAAIADTWVSKTTGEVLESFAILTHEPHPLLKQMKHDRTPLFLDETHSLEWIRPSQKGPQELLDFLTSHATYPEFSAQVDRPLKKSYKKHPI